MSSRYDKGFVSGVEKTLSIPPNQSGGGLTFENSKFKRLPSMRQGHVGRDLLTLPTVKVSGQSGGQSKKKKLSPHIERALKYSKDHNVSYKEALIALKGSKSPQSSIASLQDIPLRGIGSQKGGNPAVAAIAGQALGVGNNLISTISKGVTDRMDKNGFYNRERLRNDRKQLNKLIMDLYVEQHRLGRKNYTREDAEVEALRLARLNGLMV